MLPPIPRLEDYGLSPQTGFLPDQPPLQRLPHQVYDRWERIANNFHALILSKRLRVIIKKLPVIPAVHLETEAEWRRAYVLLCFMANGYIWGEEKPATTLPPSITYPLLQICDHLELPPVATFAGVCLWNFKPIFYADNLGLDNLSTLLTFTGSTDEQWFYLVSVAIEAEGGKSIPIMLDAIQAARENDALRVTACLQSLAQILDQLGSLLLRMYENCDPHVFYHRIRPFLAGSKNMKAAGLPQGVFYDDGTKNASWRQYSGGSNAQSSLIQFFDIILGVEHAPTRAKMNESSESDTGADTEVDDHNNNNSSSSSSNSNKPKQRHSFIHEMRQYMPGQHRRFLQAVESVANIREFVGLNRSNSKLCIAYDACLAMLRALRDKHIQIVSRYVIVKSHESRSISRSRVPPPPPPPPRRRTPSRDPFQSHSRSRSPHESRGRTAMVSAAARQAPDLISNKNQQQPEDHQQNENKKKKDKKKIRGTGGTALIPFLKQARDETGEPAVDDWARKVLMGLGGRQTEADAEIAYINSLMLTTAADDLDPDPDPDSAGAGADPTSTSTSTSDPEATPLNPNSNHIVGLAGCWELEEGGGLCCY